MTINNKNTATVRIDVIEFDVGELWRGGGCLVESLHLQLDEIGGTVGVFEDETFGDP